MNNRFEINRWLLLAGKYWAENKKRLLLSLLVIGGLQAGLFSFVIIATHRSMPVHIQTMLYFVGLYGAGCLFGSMVFSDLHQQAKGINYLLLPASHLEKLLVQVFFTVLLFFIAYSLVFYLVDIPLAAIGDSVGLEEWKKTGLPLNDTFTPFGYAHIFSDADKMKLIPMHGVNYLILLFYFPVQCAFILGSVYFKRFSFIKTAIALLLLYFLFFLFYAKLLYNFTPAGVLYDNLTGWVVHPGSEEKYVRLPGWIDNIVMLLLQYAFSFVLLIATWYRLGEKQI